MAAKKASSKKSPATKTSRSKGTGGPRELVTPKKGDSRYQRRKPSGEFGEGDKVSRSLPQDRAKKAKKKVKPGYGDLGDQPVKPKKKRTRT